MATYYRHAGNIPIEDLQLDVPESVEHEFRMLLSGMEDVLYDSNEEHSSSNGSSPGSTGSWMLLERDKATDRFLMEQLFKRNKVEDDLKKSRESLPAFGMREEILDKIEHNSVVVIKGEPGCGKTTQIPQYILDSYTSKGNGSLCRIMCTQPRRISAIGVAERVAQERREHLGEGSSVGYQIRLDSKLPRENGSIVYCTTGTMFNWLFKDPYLWSYSHIILDEVHERNLETDVLIIILRELLKKRTNLKLILMSATMRAESFSQYFDNCPIIEIPGLNYPVQRIMLEDIIEMTGFESRGSDTAPIYMKNFIEVIQENYSSNTLKVLRNWNEDNINFDLIVQLLKHICINEPMGAVLIFLPGWEEITTLYHMLLEDTQKMFSTQNFRFVLLHSLIPIEDQQLVFEIPPEGVRKIVISTDIAETSITIDDVLYVIDSGKMKVTNFDIKKNIVKLNCCWIAKSNAHQRKGRAGRLQPGKCYHLFTSHREELLEEYRSPEILRSNLVNMCLKIKIHKFGGIKELLSKAMDKPTDKSIDMAIDLLKGIKAVDDDEKLTSLGLILAQLPLDLRLGKMVLYGAIFSCLDPILTIAAALEHKSPFYCRRQQQKFEKEIKLRLSSGSHSDHIVIAQAFKLWEASESKSDFCREYFLVESTLETIAKLRHQFANDLYSLGFLLKNDPNHPLLNKNSENVELVKGIICAGLYPRVAVRLEDGCFTIENGRVFLHPQSILHRNRHNCKWMVYFNKMQTTRVYLYDVTPVSNKMLYLFGGNIKDEDMMMDEWILIKARSMCERNVLRDVRKTFVDIVNDVIKKRRILDWEVHTCEMAFLVRVISYFTTPEEASEKELPIRKCATKTRYYQPRRPPVTIFASLT